jgi:hypothetical protein
MNKSHVTARSATRARSSAADARMRQTLIELDDIEELDDVGEGPLMAAILEDDDDWTETETEAGAPDINFLLHGYR